MRVRLNWPPPIHDRGSASVASTAAAKAWSCSVEPAVRPRPRWCRSSAVRPVPRVGVVPGHDVPGARHRWPRNRRRPAGRRPRSRRPGDRRRPCSSDPERRPGAAVGSTPVRPRLCTGAGVACGTAIGRVEGSGCGLAIGRWRGSRADRGRSGELVAWKMTTMVRTTRTGMKTARQRFRPPNRPRRSAAAVAVVALLTLAGRVVGSRRRLSPGRPSGPASAGQRCREPPRLPTAAGTARRAVDAAVRRILVPTTDRCRVEFRPMRGACRPVAPAGKAGGVRTSAAWIDGDPASSQSDEGPTGRGGRPTTRAVTRRI